MYVIYKFWPEIMIRWNVIIRVRGLFKSLTLNMMINKRQASLISSVTERISPGQGALYTSLNRETWIRGCVWPLTPPAEGRSDLSLVQEGYTLAWTRRTDARWHYSEWTLCILLNECHICPAAKAAQWSVQISRITWNCANFSLSFLQFSRKQSVCKSSKGWMRQARGGYCACFCLAILWGCAQLEKVILIAKVCGIWVRN